MEKVISLVFVVLCLSIACAADEWGDINVNGSESEGVESVVQDEVVSSPVQVGSSEGATFFTENFYFALIVVLIALAIVGFFVWLWIRGPRNKWD